MRLIIIAGVTGLLIALLGTPVLIGYLRRRGHAQAIRVSENGVRYPAHEGKVGTPSMGGLMIGAGALFGYATAHALTLTPPTVSALLAMGLMAGLMAVGFLDDYLKVFRRRSSGVRARTKLIGQTVVAIAFALLSVQFVDVDGIAPASQAISLIRDLTPTLPLIVFLLWIWFLVTATTNAVNITDGLDGLATGAAALTVGSYVLIALFQFNQTCTGQPGPGCYEVRDPLDLAVFAAAIGGALIGFLWWNTSPAQIFMGDTGSLGIGGAIAALAIFTRTELLLALVGGLFVLVTLSVVVQVISFRTTGRRVLRMSPIHHHFEMLGWPEQQIVVRFWLVQALCVVAGLALFYWEWIRT
ncbi:MAG: phospho-N-acetylmuramoyl-pentapeptide-transferase [Actinomycetales bacterium]|nr:phospho-N-acetylmuramoyl-pentapeptide-transferase [Actinomycetales bacterium]